MFRMVARLNDLLELSDCWSRCLHRRRLAPIRISTSLRHNLRHSREPPNRSLSPIANGFRCKIYPRTCSDTSRWCSCRAESSRASAMHGAFERRDGRVAVAYRGDAEWLAGSAGGSGESGPDRGGPKGLGWHVLHLSPPSQHSVRL